MTALDPVAAFVTALTPRHRRDLNVTAALVAHIHEATRRGWTTQQLINTTTHNHGGATNPGGVIAYRLATKCAKEPPPLHDNVTELGTRLPFCSDECRANAGWINDNNGRPVDRCPCRTPTPQEAPA